MVWARLEKTERKASSLFLQPGMKQDVAPGTPWSFNKLLPRLAVWPWASGLAFLSSVVFRKMEMLLYESSQSLNT